MISELPLEIVERIMRYSLPPLRFDRTPRREALRSYSRISHTWLEAVRTELQRNQYVQPRLGQKYNEIHGFGARWAATLRVGFKDDYEWDRHSYAAGKSSLDISDVFNGCRNLRRLYMANLEFVMGSVCFDSVASTLTHLCLNRLYDTKGGDSPYSGSPLPHLISVTIVDMDFPTMDQLLPLFSSKLLPSLHTLKVVAHSNFEENEVLPGEDFFTCIEDDLAAQILHYALWDESNGEVSYYALGLHRFSSLQSLALLDASSALWHLAKLPKQCQPLRCLRIYRPFEFEQRLQKEGWEASEFKPEIIEIPRPFGNVAGLLDPKVLEEEGISRRKIRYKYFDDVVNTDSWESILDYMDAPSSEST